MNEYVLLESFYLMLFVFTVVPAVKRLKFDADRFTDFLIEVGVMLIQLAIATYFMYKIIYYLKPVIHWLMSP